MSGPAIRNYPFSEERSYDELTEPFSQIYETHRFRIFRFLLISLCDPDTAATLTDKCFQKAKRQLDLHQHELNISVWLFRLAISHRNRHLRRNSLCFWRRFRITPAVAGQLQSWLTETGTPRENLSEARERIAVLWTALRNLNRAQQTIFLLRFVDNMPLTEIAEATGLHDAAVRTSLLHSLIVIRSQLALHCRAEPH